MSVTAVEAYATQTVEWHHERYSALKNPCFDFVDVGGERSIIHYAVEDLAGGHCLLLGGGNDTSLE